MIVYKGSNINNKFKNSVLAIGNFDGVHLGHQKVLQEAKKKAKDKKLKFGVLTFEPIPVMFFNRNIKNHRINSLQQKIEFLKKQKIDFLIIQKFNINFSKLSYLDFIQKIIYKKLNCKFLFVSKNFKFGKNRKGDIKKLKLLEDKFKYKTVITNPCKKGNKTISSTTIRKLISQGKIKEANIFLNRSWSIRGKVIEGKKRGRTIGFPTCNIELKDYIRPKIGVYSVYIKNKYFFKKGIANIGYRPTFKGQKILLEVNIFGINKNLYKSVLNINFKKFIRSEKKFKNIKELKKQIIKDIKKSKK